MEKMAVCPHCSKKLSSDAELAGRQVRCPACRGVFAVEAAPVRQGLPDRPASVITFGVLNIVFAALGLLFSSQVIGAFASMAAYSSVRTERSGIPAWPAMAILGGAIGIAILIWQLAAGIGLLNCKNWARRGLVVYGWTVAIMAGLIVIFDAPFFVLAGVDGEAKEIFVYGFLLGQGLCGMIFSVLMAVFLSKPHVVAACDRTRSPVWVAKTNAPRAADCRQEEAERHYLEGKEHWKEYRGAQALQAFKKALAINPDHEGALYQVAFIHDRDNDPAKAMLGYQRLAFKYPNNSQYDRAVTELQQVVNNVMGPAAVSLYGGLMRPNWRAFVNGLPGKSDSAILNA